MSRHGSGSAIMIALAAWILMQPPSTWYWHNCVVEWDYDAPVEKWGPLYDPVSTREECEAQRSEMVKRESSHRAAAIENAKSREQRGALIDKLFERFLYDASTSALCVAMADVYAHARCREIGGAQTPGR
jgi:hypothetical protein